MVARGHPLWLPAVLAGVRSHGRRFYDSEGIDTFKAKFRPERWEPVDAICNEPRFSPATLYATAAALTGNSPVAAVVGALVRPAGFFGRDVDLA